MPFSSYIDGEYLYTWRSERLAAEWQEAVEFMDWKRGTVTAAWWEDDEAPPVMDDERRERIRKNILDRTGMLQEAAG